MIEVRAGLRIVGLRQPEPRGQHVSRVEPEIDVLQAPEAAHEQRGADEQHEREREFGDHESRIAEARGHPTQCRERPPSTTR